jgi:hypothetical protein
VPSGDERRHARHTTPDLLAALDYPGRPPGQVPVTVTAKNGVSFESAAGTVLVPRGQLLHYEPRILTRQINEGRVVQVDVAKLGKAQRQLLVKLLEATEAAGRDAKGSPTERASWRWYGPSGVSPAAGRGVRWRPERMIVGPVTMSAISAVGQALAKLERRGLIIRNAPAGSREHTRMVQLTGAGMLVARALARRAPSKPL